MLVVTGHQSRIIRELAHLLPASELMVAGRAPEVRTDAERYVFAQGYLAGKAPNEITEEERDRTVWDNWTSIVLAIDAIMAANDSARVVVVGSESAFAGSYDESYALAKAKVAEYCENKRLTSRRQQLVCVAPWIIEDAGMTLRRRDLARLEAKCSRHPKQRFVTSAEVARLIYFLLYADQGYLSGLTIRMHGGAPAWAAL